MTSLFRREAGFYRRLWVLTLPIVLQNLITTSLGFADTFMVCLLGNAEMAAVTAANVPIFIIQLVIFGFQSGLAVLLSQYWGKGDTDSINRCMGIALYAVILFSLAIALTTFFLPAEVMRLVTPNEDLVALGTPYIRIVGFANVFNGISSVYAGMQRSTENPRFGMILFAISMCVNTFLNFVLIFGKFGAPRMGITGAAAATLISRIVEFAAALGYALRSPRIPLRPGLILQPGRDTARRFVKYSVPVVCNETLWGTGTSMLTVIMGHMANSQDMLAAYSLMGNIDKLSTVVCFGLAASAAVMVGKEIGEGRNFDHVYDVARTLLAVSVLVGAAVMVLQLLLLPAFFQPVLFPLFQLSPGAARISTYLAIVYAIALPTRAFDVTNVTGVLRAGGDTRVAVLIDVLPLWLFTVPLMALCALVLDVPVLWVCLCLQSETLCKFPLGIFRFRSRKWIHDITRSIE